VPGAERLDFRDVDAFSDAVAYILSIGPGEASRIFKTTDGGANWTLQLANSDPAIFLDAMAFSDATHGLAFSDSAAGRFVIFRTTDGERWERIPAESLPAALDGEGAYAGSGTNVAVMGNRAWIGTTASRVLRSTDSGRTWTVAATPVATGEATGIFSLAFSDPMHGVAVGGNYTKEREAVHNAAYTADGGATWSLPVRGLSGFRSVVAHVPGTTASFIAVGPSGADRSDDGGKTWTVMEAEGFHAFSFAPRPAQPAAAGANDPRPVAIGWGAGERGRISRLELTR
jgi:photosystem II stability/assembly factor-like uncharacterized protein